jgi:DNA polymerase III delta prime subunit
LARIIASQLLSISVEQLDTHPDFFYIERMYDEKTAKRKKELTVEQTRNLKMRLQTTSWAQGFRCIIIDEVELLNDEAGNALLKLLEEPARQTIFFLLTTDDTLLLPTIRSRATCIYLNPVLSVDISEVLKQKGFSLSEAEYLASVSWGRPGRALQLSAQTDRQTQYKDALHTLESMINTSLAERFKIIEELMGGKKEVVVSREELDTILEIWVIWWRQKMVYSSEYATASKAMKMILELFQVRQLLQRNINPRVLLENLVMQF